MGSAGQSYRHSGAGPSLNAEKACRSPRSTKLSVSTVNCAVGARATALCAARQRGAPNIPPSNASSGRHDETRHHPRTSQLISHRSDTSFERSGRALDASIRPSEGARRTVCCKRHGLALSP